jgi:hypothetical protein
MKSSELGKEVIKKELPLIPKSIKMIFFMLEKLKIFPID